MNLVRWLLAVHLVAIAAASGVALVAECDGDKLRALCIAMMVTGWTTGLSAVVFLVRTLIKRPVRARDIVLSMVLLFIGFHESSKAAHGWEYLSALPG